MNRKSDPILTKAAVEQLRALKDKNFGQAPTWAIEAIAMRHGCTPRTVRRWIKDDVPDARQCNQLGKEELSAIAAEQGRLNVAWSKLHNAGLYNKSYRQFVRDFHKSDLILSTAATQGVPAALHKGLYLKVFTTAKLELVAYDHTQAPIFIKRLTAGSIELFRPWISILIDLHTRVILSCVVTEGDGIGGDPGTESVICLLASAIRGQEARDGTFIGGLPLSVQYDNAKAHTAQAMLNGFIELGISGHAIRKGSPWENGRAESIMRTVQSEFFKGLPGYVDGLGDRYNRKVCEPEGCLIMEELMAHLQVWIDDYNFERVHSALGCTPFEAWREDKTVIARVDENLLRHSFLMDKNKSGNPQTRTISKNGLMWRNIQYVHEYFGKHPTLGSLIGRKVTIRFLPNDRSFVDVYLNGEFLCTAVPYQRLSKERGMLILRERNSQIRHADKIVKQAQKRALQRELEGNPMLAPQRDPSAPLLPLPDDSDEILAELERAIATNWDASND